MLGVMNTLRPCLAVISCLLLAGCISPVASHSYVGIAKNDTSWPYRYKLTNAGGGWSGNIEHRVPDGWVSWDSMEIVQQKEGEISFRALSGEPRKAIPLGWHLSLGHISDRGFSGRLTGDAFDSSAIEILFKPLNAEKSGPANGQPICSETNRTSSAAGSCR
jgi:hypothetical protein